MFSLLEASFSVGWVPTDSLPCPPALSLSLNCSTFFWRIKDKTLFLKEWVLIVVVGFKKGKKTDGNLLSRRRHPLRLSVPPHKKADSFGFLRIVSSPMTQELTFSRLREKTPKQTETDVGLKGSAEKERREHNGSNLLASLPLTSRRRGRERRKWAQIGFLQGQPKERVKFISLVLKGKMEEDGGFWSYSNITRVGQKHMSMRMREK